MVPLTRLNGGTLHLNADLIASVEEFHDTVVTLVDGRCVVVHETAEQVVAEVVRYRAHVLALADELGRGERAEEPAQQPAQQPAQEPATPRARLRVVPSAAGRVVPFPSVPKEA